MKTFQNIQKSSLMTLGSLIVILCCNLLLSCSKDLEEFEPEEVYSNNDLKAASLLTVIPSQSSIKIGGCLYFTIKLVDSYGKPVIGASVGVNDPIRQMSIVAGKTNAYGTLVYYCDNYCPAKYNDMYGNFTFVFSAGGLTKSCNVLVNLVPPVGVRDVKVLNNTLRNYKIQVYVNGTNKGIYSVGPGLSSTLWKDNNNTTSVIDAYVRDNYGKNLYKVTYNYKPTYSFGTSTIINPTFSNYFTSSTTTSNGITKNFYYSGSTIPSPVYSNVVSKSVSVGGKQFSVINGSNQGIKYNAGGTIQGPGCEVYLGAKATCEVKCSAGADIGLQLCIGAGPGIAFGPLKAGCTASCCITVASASCQVASASFGITSGYK